MEDDTKKTPDLDLTPVDQELDLELLEKTQENGEDDEPQFRLQSRRDERQLALYFLYALDRTEYSVDLADVVKIFSREFEINIPQGSFAIVLAQGVVDKQKELDEFLTPFLKNWRLERLGCCTRLILHIALWELQQPDAIGSIIINEAVELTKMFAEKDAYRFVNGILDEIAKKVINADSTESTEPAVSDIDDDIDPEEEV